MIRRWTLIAVLLASGACGDDGSEVETGGDTDLGGDTPVGDTTAGDTAEDAAADVADSLPADDTDMDGDDAPDTVADSSDAAAADVLTDPDVTDSEAVDTTMDTPADTTGDTPPDTGTADAPADTPADTSADTDTADTPADTMEDTVADTVTADTLADTPADTVADTGADTVADTGTADARDTTADADADEVDTTCEERDFEPNDGENTAQGLPSVECATPVTGRRGTLVAGNTDWFRFDRTDGLCLATETIGVTADVALQVCAYVACEGVSAPATFDCLVGSAATSPLGRAGCCGSGTVEFEWDCEGGFTSIDDVTVWFSVTSDEAACSEYTIGYGE